MVTSLKDLAKLIALCRKAGVQSIKVDNIEFHLGAEPTPKLGRKKSKLGKAIWNGTATNGVSNEPIEQIESDGLTPEQLLNWSIADLS